MIRSPFQTHKYSKSSRRVCESRKYSPLHQEAWGAFKFGLKEDFFGLESQITSFVAVVGVKTGGSRVGGPKLCVLGSMVT